MFCSLLFKFFSLFLFFRASIVLCDISYFCLVGIFYLFFPNLYLFINCFEVSFLLFQFLHFIFVILDWFVGIPYLDTADKELIRSFKTRLPGNRYSYLLGHVYVDLIVGSPFLLRQQYAERFAPHVDYFRGHFATFVAPWLTFFCTFLCTQTFSVCAYVAERCLYRWRCVLRKCVCIPPAFPYPVGEACISNNPEEIFYDADFFEVVDIMETQVLTGPVYDNEVQKTTSPVVGCFEPMRDADIHLPLDSSTVSTSSETWNQTNLLGDAMLAYLDDIRSREVQLVGPAICDADWIVSTGWEDASISAYHGEPIDRFSSTFELPPVAYLQILPDYVPLDVSEHIGKQLLNDRHAEGIEICEHSINVPICRATNLKLCNCGRFFARRKRLISRLVNLFHKPVNLLYCGDTRCHCWRHAANYYFDMIQPPPRYRISLYATRKSPCCTGLKLPRKKFLTQRQYTAYWTNPCMRCFVAVEHADKLHLIDAYLEHCYNSSHGWANASEAGSVYLYEPGFGSTAPEPLQLLHEEWRSIISWKGFDPP